MIGLLWFALAILASPFKSKLRLEAENAVLRHQLIVLRRRPHGRVQLTNRDRWFFVQLSLVSIDPEGADARNRGYRKSRSCAPNSGATVDL